MERYSIINEQSNGFLFHFKLQLLWLCNLFHLVSIGILVYCLHLASSTPETNICCTYKRLRFVYLGTGIFFWIQPVYVYRITFAIYRPAEDSFLTVMATVSVAKILQARNHRQVWQYIPMKYRTQLPIWNDKATGMNVWIRLQMKLKSLIFVICFYGPLSSVSPLFTRARVDSSVPW